MPETIDKNNFFKNAALNKFKSQNNSIIEWGTSAAQDSSTTKINST